ncbi:HTH domain-containing protein [Staphylococcus sp. ACRSN]|uniref:HTH domain-containing protein n=1 Tax=Staphylococcus sp. ACRSN TaxID=2918214 RepID=UPI001EF2ECE5|nr:HTH domain-containing protein [Staphylococcus sp. ACRSN]MCG7339612.1 HTH domain-containing protein [Staphylococcus sp. ACRSN]
MEKPERLLYIYTRFLNGKTLNKEALAKALNVNLRTIQRDISDLNHFIYEDAEWQGLEGSIVYDKYIEQHRLKINKYKFESKRLLNLVFRMKTFTPIIHEDTYNLIRGLNANINLGEKTLSNKLLSQFKLNKVKVESQLIFNIQIAIEYNEFISLAINNQNKIKVIPIYTRYYDRKHWFTYYYHGTITCVNLDNVREVTTLSDQFETDIIEKIEPTTFHFTTSIWEEIHKQFIIVHTQNVENGIVAKIIISQQETLQLAYKYANDITILHPQAYVDAFKLKLKNLFTKYK